MTEPVLEIEDLTITYRTEEGEGDVHAVTDASFSIDENEYFGLVGESGCGKSTIAKSIIGGLDENGEITSGTIKIHGEEVQDYSEAEFNGSVRWEEVALIPQASMNSLDPLTRVSDQAVQIAQAHTSMTETEVLDHFEELFEVVGLPESRIHDYPHQFSGGMQQRALIAMSLLLKPSLIIADEPTTALDVIMQDQILKHLNELRDDWDISMLLITHDISVVFENCQSIAVMHGGQVAETGETVDIFLEPRHPYTILLQQAFPDIRDPDSELSVIEGTPPQLRAAVDHCTFADRCPWSVEECRAGAPPQESVEDDPTHRVACIRSSEMTELAADELQKRERYRSERRDEHPTTPQGTNEGEP
ncbi:ABC transporter ATP-binding protein [Haloplanus rallus]|jgi:oligopeptide/dipeptide ABC transporter ATP-binding protein|uniref:ABC transporter ATP-binding protein n=1 Tax=Haloplanus rallus TaxID=1816183 RepID=A0A6B9FF63_9EURY|nr:MULTISPECIES: ABC transporter ATP-binding protein [Haloplanus]QGX94273.1 ABC transporter ATP-binding protein [Haloplanus rallus]